MITRSIPFCPFRGTVKVLNPEQTESTGAVAQITQRQQDENLITLLEYIFLKRNTPLLGGGDKDAKACKLQVGDICQLTKNEDQLSIVINDHSGKPAYQWLVNLAEDVKENTKDHFNSLLGGILLGYNTLKALVEKDKYNDLKLDNVKNFLKQNQQVLEGTYQVKSRPEVSPSTRKLVAAKLEMPPGEPATEALINMFGPENIEAIENEARSTSR